MTEKIDRMALLCGKGYLPAELPPTFSSVDFGNNARHLLRAWQANGIIPTNENNFNRLKSTEAEVISTPKRSHERRIIHLTNPVPQLLLSYLISKNWVNIDRLLKKSKYTTDVSYVSNSNRRAVSNIDFFKHSLHKDRIESYANYILRSDISRYYPSIYTHSIPWAFYGKEKVKSDIRKYKHSLGDKIDILIRKCNRDQSVGIPIGPDTSRIVADIISGYVDCQIYDKTGMTFHDADRLQDDWFISCKNLQEAERRLAELQISYGKLGLEINGSKTNISSINSPVPLQWKSTLLHLMPQGGKKFSASAMRTLCSACLELQSQNPHDSVVRYVMPSLFKMAFSDDHLPILESFLLKAIILDPKSADIICTLLLNLRHERRLIDVDRIKMRFIPFVEEAMEKEHHYEAIWGLYALRGLHIDISSSRIPELSEYSYSSCIPLILLDMQSKSATFRLNTKIWEKAIRSSELTDGMWLLAYEGERHGWLNTSRLSSIYLEPMKNLNIQFYNDKRNVHKRQVIAEENRKRMVRHLRFMRQFVKGY